MFSTSIQIAFIVVLAFFFRFLKVFREGDEAVLNSYVYYVALPSFLFLELNTMKFNALSMKIVVITLLSMLIVVVLFWIIQRIFRLDRRIFSILSLSSVFGSTAFFGIPFVTFSYPQPEFLQLTALIASVSGVVGLSIVVVLLELEIAGKLAFKDLVRILLKRFARNPLIISILLGLTTNLAGIRLGGGIYKGLDMLGKSTAVTAIFMLGLFLYGKKYRKIVSGLLLSLLRVVLVPIVTYVIARSFGLSGDVLNITVLLSAMPVAITMITITQKYDFEKDLFANIVMVSSLSALVYLNLIRFILGVR